MAQPSVPIASENAEQFEYWNSPVVDKWLENQASLDARFTKLTDRLFHYASIAAGERIIDIGCGTGQTAIRAAETAGPRGRVVGVDLSEAMLALARERTAACGMANRIDLQLADAQTAAFKEAGFQLAMSRFGVMFFVEPTKAFANINRALQSGGRLVFVCWGPLAENPWFKVGRDAAIRHLGEPEPQPPRAPGPLAFAEPDYVGEILTAANFDDIAITTERCMLMGLETVEKEAAFACRMGPAARLIAAKGASPDTVAAIAKDIEPHFAEFLTANGVRIPATVHFVTATRP